jgi:hypothetical protein
MSNRSHFVLDSNIWMLIADFISLNRLLSFHTGFLEGKTDSEVLNAAVSKREIVVFLYNCKISEGELSS